MTKTQHRPTNRQSSRYRGPVWGVAVFVAILTVAGLYFAFTDDSGELAENPPPPTTTLSPDVDTMTGELLNGFLEARIAGDGVQQYLGTPEEDIPLLYATSSGASYERGEFEQVPGVEWPYGFRAFKTRLFAGDTVVEQVIFMFHDDPERFPTDDRWLEYSSDGFGTHIAPTSEDGQPVAVPYDPFNGEVTMHFAHPWAFNTYDFDLDSLRLIPEGSVRPTTDGGERREWDELWVLADPAVFGAGCQTSIPADAEALAESIRSYPGVEATAPVAVSAGGTEALMMDVVVPAGAIICERGDQREDLHNQPVQSLLFDKSAPAVDEGLATGRASGEWMRLYMFDAPEGSSMRTMAIAVVAPESSFERAVEAAKPVIDSVEFHAP